MTEKYNGWTNYETTECQNAFERLELSVNIQALRRFVNEIATFSGECLVTVEPADGLHVRVVDPAHIAMMDTWLAKEMCDVWRPNAYGFEFAIDVAKIQKMLKSEKDREANVNVTVDTLKRELILSMPSGTMTSKLLDATGMSDPKVPTLTLPFVAIVTSAKAFRQALKNASEVGDRISISAQKTIGDVQLSAENDMDRMQSTIQCEVERSETDALSNFPLEYLANIAKLLPDGFHLELGTDYPIKLRYGRTQILLAPRIETQD